MKIKVTKNECILEEEHIVNKGEYNITEIEFDFDEEYTNDLVKKAIFATELGAYEKIIINNKCTIPEEVLQEKGYVVIGVYAYKVTEETLELRYSPKPFTKFIEDGSYTSNILNSEEITPTDKEQIEQAIANLEDTKVDKVEGKGLSTNDFTDENKRILDSITDEDISNWNNKAEISDIPTNLSQLNEDSTHRLVTDTEKTTWNNKSDFSGNYNDLTNKPNIPTKTSDLTNDNGFIDKTVDDLTNYTLKTNTGSLIDLEINQSTYVVTLKLKNQDGTVISTDTIDLPLESVVVGGSYDAVNKKIVLTLENGNTVDIPVGDLIAGLQTEITSQNKLASDLVDDSNSGNKFVTTSEKSSWNGKYDKPVGGIPSTDLAEEYVKPTDYATTGKGGTIKLGYGLKKDNTGCIYPTIYTYEQYTQRSNETFINKGTLEAVITGKQLVNQTYVDTLVGNINTLLDTLNRTEV